MEEEYINFGDELILKSDFLKAINDAKAYSATQPWSAARRGAFDAVSELAANRGILSTRKYTNPETGESMYYATFGGDPFDINTYDKNTRRGWLDYVNFVGRLAESLPTKKSIDEKKKKEEEERIAKLPTFDNTAFINLLTGNISKGPLGGQKWDVNLWNTLDDVRDEKGAVGIDNRKTELIKLLRDIDKNFKAEDYNWKDSPFLDADDFKARLAKAIGALESKDLNDDTPALRELGLNYKDWFNNRTGETMLHPTTGEEVTYGNYYRGLQALKDAKILAANAKAEAARKAYNANLIGGLKWYGKGLTGSPLSPENSNLDYLNLLAAKDSWSGDELSQLVGTFKLAQRNNALENLSKEELATFGRFGSNPNRFKKIKGLDGIYWDSLTNQIAKPYTRGQLNNGVNFLDILDLNNSEKLKLKQLNTPRGNGNELTTSDYIDIGATLADLGALVNPEIISGTVMSLGAAGARTLNRDWTNGDLWDNIWKSAIDLGTGALGGTPLLGDASSLYKFARGFGKLMTIPAVWNALGSTGEAKQALSKLKFDSIDNLVTSLKSLTPNDYHAISSVLTGLIAGRGHIRNNLAEREVLKQSGITTESKSKIREYSNKFGLTRTKPLDQKTVSTLKVKKTGKDGKVDEKVVELNEKQRTAIQKAKASEIEKVAKDEGVEIPEGYKVEVNKSKINSVRSYYLRPLGRANSEVIGKLTLTASRGKDNFETWLLDRSIWNKWKYGSNKNLRRIRENLGIKPIQQENSETPSTTPKTETSASNQSHFAENESSRIINEIENSYNPPSYKLKRLTKQISVKDGKSELNGKLINGSDYKVEYRGTKDTKGNWSTNNAKMVVIKDGTEIPIKGKTLGELKQNLGKWIKELNDKIKLSSNHVLKKDDPNWKAFVESIRKMKRQGYLYKQGGTLTLDKTIENFLKNNNI